MACAIVWLRGERSHGNDFACPKGRGTGVGKEMIDLQLHWLETLRLWSQKITQIFHRPAAATKSQSPRLWSKLCKSPLAPWGRGGAHGGGSGKLASLRGSGQSGNWDCFRDLITEDQGSGYGRQEMSQRNHVQAQALKTIWGSHPPSLWTLDGMAEPGG